MPRIIEHLNYCRKGFRRRLLIDLEKPIELPTQAATYMYTRNHVIV